MARPRDHDEFGNLSHEQRQARLRLIAGYIVERDRVPKMSSSAPQAASPP